MTTSILATMHACMWARLCACMSSELSSNVLYKGKSSTLMHMFDDHDYTVLSIVLTRMNPKKRCLVSLLLVMPSNSTCPCHPSRACVRACVRACMFACVHAGFIEYVQYNGGNTPHTAPIAIYIVVSTWTAAAVVHDYTQPHYILAHNIPSTHHAE